LSPSQPTRAPHTPLSRPTRRSSDLNMAMIGHQQHRAANLARGLQQGGERANRLRLPVRLLLRIALERGIDGIDHHRYQTSLLVLDRKSTRLNSSHVKISYAVFCLKK